jgi:hypothetical protein
MIINAGERAQIPAQVTFQLCVIPFFLSHENEAKVCVTLFLHSLYYAGNPRPYRKFRARKLAAKEGKFFVQTDMS